MKIINSKFSKKKEIKPPDVSLKEDKERIKRWDEMNAPEDTSDRDSDDELEEDRDRWTYKEMVKNEFSLDSYQLNDDYLELAIQLSYITLFAVAFPVAPLLAVVNNMYESGVDLLKLTGCRRNRIDIKINLKIWLQIFEVILIISIFTNTYVLCMVSTHIKVVFPTTFHTFLSTQHGKFVALILIEHMFLGIKFACYHLISEVPQQIETALLLEKQSERIENASVELEHQNIGIINLFIFLSIYLSLIINLIGNFNPFNSANITPSSTPLTTPFAPLSPTSGSLTSLLGRYLYI
jgi:anoctamin-10/anoctamin-7